VILIGSDDGRAYIWPDTRRLWQIPHEIGEKGVRIFCVMHFYFLVLSYHDCPPFLSSLLLFIFYIILFIPTGVGFLGGSWYLQDAFSLSLVILSVEELHNTGEMMLLAGLASDKQGSNSGHQGRYSGEASKPTPLPLYIACLSPRLAWLSSWTTTAGWRSKCVKYWWWKESEGLRICVQIPINGVLHWTLLSNVSKPNLRQCFGVQVWAWGQCYGYHYSAAGQRKETPWRSAVHMFSSRPVSFFASRKTWPLISSPYRLGLGSNGDQWGRHKHLAALWWSFLHDLPSKYVQCTRMLHGHRRYAT